MALLTSGAADLARVPASRRISTARPSAPREGRGARRTLAARADAKLLASAERGLAFVPRVDRELRFPERSTVVYGGSLVSLRRDGRTRGGGTIRDGRTVFARVGGTRSTAPAVASLRVGSRTVRVGLGESFDSPGARRV